MAFLIAALKLSDAWSKTESGSCARLRGWAKDSLKMKKKIKKKKKRKKQPNNLSQRPNCPKKILGSVQI